jgi:alpha-beta hydrolase superfamily lysophospholipase
MRSVPSDNDGAEKTSYDPADEGRDIPGLRRIVSSLPVDHMGTFVYLRGWRKEESQWPPIVFVHDLGEQADEYAAAAESFVVRGYTCYAFDLRGHGRSGRLLGHLTRFDSLVKDLLQVAAWVKHKESGQSPVIIGQGVGALIAAEFAHRFAGFCGGMVLASPCFELSRKPSLPLKSLLKVSSEIWPTWRPPRLLSPNFTETLAAPLRLTSASIDTILDAMNRSDRMLQKCAVNTLILCPEHDPIASYQTLKKTVAMHSNPKLKAVDLGGMSRGMFKGKSDTCQTAIDEISAWLEPQRVRPKPTIHPSEPRPSHPLSALDALSTSDPAATVSAAKD